MHWMDARHDGWTLLACSTIEQAMHAAAGGSVEARHWLFTTGCFWLELLGEDDPRGRIRAALERHKRRRKRKPSTGI